MSRDFRPHAGCRLIAVWPSGKPIPEGWSRVQDWPLIERVATGEAADTAVEVSGYTETADCGVANTGTVTGA